MPTLSFLGYFEKGDPVKVPMHKNVIVTCLSSNAFPSPILTASIVDSNDGHLFELENPAGDPEVLKDNNDQTITLKKNFTLFMSEDAVGKYVQCTSDQGIGYDAKAKKQLAILCGCSEFGSPNNICDLGNGQCQCYPNFKGLNCDKCADGFENDPECTGKYSKSVLML